MYSSTYFPPGLVVPKSAPPPVIIKTAAVGAADKYKKFVDEYKRIVMLVKGVHGEVYGESVREVITHDSARGAQQQPLQNQQQYQQQRKSTTIPRIRSRVNDQRTVATLIRLLRIDYKVTPVEPKDCQDYTDGIYIVHLNQEACSPSLILFEISTVLRNIWRLERPFFDVDALASNSGAVFVYPLATPLDVFNIIARITKKEFSLLHTGGSTQLLSHAVQAAIRMVLDGWTMDANILGERSWMVSTWRQAQAEANKSYSQECCICQDAFQSADVVVRLPCGHAFHGYCDRERDTQGALGICEWLKDNRTCPCCRQAVGR